MICKVIYPETQWFFVQLFWVQYSRFVGVWQDLVLYFNESVVVSFQPVDQFFIFVRQFFFL